MSAIPSGTNRISVGSNAAMTEKMIKSTGAGECQTCKNRKYQDGSNDPGVTFKSPTHISPQAAASQVAAHEGQHVSHEQSKAAKNDREVVSVQVSIQTGICPECGKPYVEGGKTRVVTKADNSDELRKKTLQRNGIGNIVDLTA